MSELSFEQMLEDSVKTIRNGEIVQGTVIGVQAIRCTGITGIDCISLYW